MSNLEYKDEYWDQALNILQVEENWMDAQVVLRRAERKQVIIRYSSFAALFLLVFGIGYWTYNSQHALANRLKLSSTAQINFDSKKKNSAKTNIEIGVNTDSHNKRNSIHDVVIKDPYSPAEKRNISKKIANETSIFERVNNKVVVDKTNTRNSHQLVESTWINDTGKKSKSEGDFDGEMKSPELTQGVNKEDSREMILLKNKSVVEENNMKKQDKNNSLNLNSDHSSKEKNHLFLIGNRNLFSKPYAYKAVLIENYHSIRSKIRPRLNVLKFVIGTSRITGFGSDNRSRINPEIGLEYQRYFNNNVSIVTGLSYFSIDGLNHSTSFSDVEVGFDKFEKRVSYSSNKVHYLFTPLLLKWEFNKYHSLTIGGGLSYFLTNNSIAETSTFENEILLTNTSEESTGYAQGYRTFNTSILGGYEFSFNRRTSLGIQYQYGLNTVVNDEVYEANNRDRNSRIRILLTRRIR